MILNKYLLNIILINIFNSIILINCKRIYWPPITNKKHLFELENSLNRRLEKGCPKKDLIWNEKQEPEHFFAVTQTENPGLGSTTPTQFTHIASGYQISFNNSCSDCKSNQFHFDGVQYKTENFECRNLCIFDVNKIEGECMSRQQNFRISIPFGHQNLEIFEACHRVGHVERLLGKPKDEDADDDDHVILTSEEFEDLLRVNDHEYLGFYSRKIWFRVSDEDTCSKKCLPVCRQFVSGIDLDDDDDFEAFDENENNKNKMKLSNDENEKVDIDLYTANFIRNLCTYNQAKRSLHESTRLFEFECNSVLKNLASIRILLISFILTNLLRFD